MEHQAKHLELIQAVVSRLAQQSFALKGISVTLVLAVFAFVGQDGDTLSLSLALLPALSFWGLDAYYLRHERLFRELYKAVAPPGSTVEPFSMDVTPYLQSVSSWGATLRSTTLRWFYGPIVFVVAVFVLLKGQS